MRDHDPVILPSHSTVHPGRGRFAILTAAVLIVLLFSFRTLVSYYVDSLWFASLGYAGVFWKSLRVEWTVFALFAVATFLILFGWCMVLLRVSRHDVESAGTIVFNNRIIRIPLDRMLRWGALALSALISLG